MGSRKKKPTPAKRKFLLWYKALTGNQKIQFKSFWFHYGRQRMSLAEILKRDYIIEAPVGALNNHVALGWSWQFHAFGQENMTF